MKSFAAEVRIEHVSSYKLFEKEIYGLWLSTPRAGETSDVKVFDCNAQAVPHECHLGLGLFHDPTSAFPGMKLIISKLQRVLLCPKGISIAAFAHS